MTLVGKKLLTVYTYANCDTCRKAVKWLRARDIKFEERAIREIPPSVAELKIMFSACAGERRRLCNTSGRDYRELKLGDRLATMTDRDVIELLASNGNLVKRPFLLGDGVALVGFNEAVWTKAFSGK